MRMEENVEMYFRNYKEIANFLDFVGQQKNTSIADILWRYAFVLSIPTSVS